MKVAFSNGLVSIGDFLFFNQCEEAKYYETKSKVPYEIPVASKWQVIDIIRSTTKSTLTKQIIEVKSKIKLQSDYINENGEQSQCFEELFTDDMKEFFFSEREALGVKINFDKKVIAGDTVWMLRRHGNYFRPVAKELIGFCSDYIEPHVICRYEHNNRYDSDRIDRAEKIEHIFASEDDLKKFYPDKSTKLRCCYLDNGGYQHRLAS